MPVFEALYREHFPFVWRALSRLGVIERDLPDAAQDVFVVIHRKLAELDPSTRVTTWIYAICMRVASDRRRSASTRYEVFTDPALVSREVGSDGDGAQVNATHHRALLAKALDALPLEQRAVFTLFELDGMTGDEIAALVSVPIATVHSRLRLARAAVRRVLERAQMGQGFSPCRVGGAS